MRRARFVAWVLSLLAFGSSLLSACTYLYEPKEVGRSFSVQVVDRGKSVAGLQIELYKYPNLSGNETRLVFDVTTDSDGLGTFTAVTPGAYTISIKNVILGPSPSEEIVVKKLSSKAARKRITIEWPGVEVLSVQSVSGLLNGQFRTNNPALDDIRPDFVPISDAKLTLQGAVSREAIGSQITSQSRAFEFHSPSAGLYFLRVEATANTETLTRGFDGYVPIEIDPSAKTSALNLFLFQGICGSLGYRNGETVTQ